MKLKGKEPKEDGECPPRARDSVIPEKKSSLQSDGGPKGNVTRVTLASLTA